MLITGDFHDYYDSVMGLGIDKTVVYNRVKSFAPDANKITQQDLCNIIDKIPMSSTSAYPIRHISAAVLLICGENIPLIRVDDDTKTHCFYSADKAIDFMKSKGITLHRHYYFSFLKYHDIRSEKGIRNFFKDTSFSVLTKLHHIHKCPIILCRNDRKGESIQLNPKLKDLSYQTQKDPYTLFQTLYAYISGVLGTPMKESLPISDEIIAANHGHDSPYSFRSLPGKKRGRKR